MSCDTKEHLIDCSMNFKLILWNILLIHATIFSPDILATNRGNNLLIKVMQHRYPRLVEEKALEALHEWLSTGNPNEQSINVIIVVYVSINITQFLDQMLTKFNVDDDLCTSILSSYVSEYSNSYPMMIGEESNFKDLTKIQLTLFLVIVLF